jgi:hypothetical protein
LLSRKLLRQIWTAAVVVVPTTMIAAAAAAADEWRVVAAWTASEGEILHCSGEYKWRRAAKR